MAHNEQKGGSMELDVLTCGGASALHASTDDGLHLVAIGSLRVMVKFDGKIWSAQGLEIDYTADGTSLDGVAKEFADGLTLTIDENLRVYGNIRNVLKPAPVSVWTEFYDGAIAEKFDVKHSQFSIHKIPVQFYLAKAA